MSQTSHRTFARLNLCDEVQDSHIERAMSLQKKLIGQTFDGEKFVPEESRETVNTHQEKRDAIKEIVADLEGKQPANVDDVTTEAMNRHGITPSDTEKAIEKLRTKGELYEPQGGEYRAT